MEQNIFTPAKNSQGRYKFLNAVNEAKQYIKDNKLNNCQLAIGNFSTMVTRQTSNLKLADKYLEWQKKNQIKFN